VLRFDARVASERRFCMNAAAASLNRASELNQKQVTFP
jgi:hypothetical protein